MSALLGGAEHPLGRVFNLPKYSKATIEKVQDDALMACAPLKVSNERPEARYQQSQPRRENVHVHDSRSNRVTPRRRRVEVGVHLQSAANGLRATPFLGPMRLRPPGICCPRRIRRRVDRFVLTDLEFLQRWFHSWHGVILTH
jgi:hypothetical protein